MVYALGAIFREIKLHLGRCERVHCPRACNAAVHGVLMEIGHYETWFGQSPKFVSVVGLA